MESPGMDELIVLTVKLEKEVFSFIGGWLSQIAVLYSLWR